MRDAVTQTRLKSRREVSAALNQAARRLRQAADLEEIAACVVDATGLFCAKAALFEVSGDELRGLRGRGMDGAGAIEEIGFSFADAAAFRSAVESRDTVVAAGTPREISHVLMELFGHQPGERAYLFPAPADDGVVEVLYAAGEAEAVDVAALELLCGLAAAALGGPDGSEAPPDSELQPRRASLISITGAAAPSDSPRPEPSRGRRTTLPEWKALSREEQDLHLRAQRFSRVRVAEMRLYKSEAVKTGRSLRDLYTALKSDIELARDVFQRDFIAACPTMVDYLHVELVSSLAQDDATLLGHAYPGPLV